MNIRTYRNKRNGNKFIQVKKYACGNFLHRAVWVEHHGEIPDGMMVSFRDSDPLNCDIDNLMLISKSENARLNRRGLRFEDPDLTDAAVSMVRLEGAIRDRRKKKK